MLKCHLSIINHSSITQFDDITLSNHDFDRVAGADFHNVSGSESRPDLSLQTDFNETYYSMFSQAQRQVYRVTERSVGRLRRDRANSCPDIVQQLNREFDDLSNSNWRYTTAHEPKQSNSSKFINLHMTVMASAAILVHTAGNTPTKGKSSQPKSNQHQLAPINQPQDPPNTGRQIIPGDNMDEDVDTIEVHMAVEMERTLITGMIIKIEELAMVKYKGTFSIIEGEVKITHLEGAEDSGMEMTPITGIEILKVKVILIGAEDGIIVEVRDIVIGEEGEDGILINNTMTQGTNNRPSLQTRIIIVHHPWDISTDTQSHMSNTHILNNNNTSRKCQPHHNKLQISANCVKVKATMIINANLQAILWPTHKKPLIKVDHITTKIRIKGSGQMATSITMTLMGNLFSSGGSQCH